jgi:hypothetical protein
MRISTLLLILNIFILNFSFSSPVYKIYIKEKGIYKISLRNFLNKEKINPEMIELTYKGKSIPFYLSNSEKIIFYSGEKENKYSKYDVYLLKFDKNGIRKTLEEILENVKDNRETKRFEENIIYDPLEEIYREYFKEIDNLNLDHWFWKEIGSKREKKFNFSIPDLNEEEKNSLKIYLQPVVLRGVNYKIEVYLNNEKIKEESWEKEKNKIIEIDTKDKLKEGKNSLKIKNLSGCPLYLNWIEVNYFLKERKIKYKSPSKILLDSPSNLKEDLNGCDYLVITLKKFSKDLIPLIRHRESQGLKVKVVDVEDIYDEFNFGNFSPLAIKDFLKYAYFNWKERKLKYVLLVGDAKVDVDFIKEDVIPSFTVKTLIGGDTATDNWFVDFDDDSIPEISIGRIPANSEKELKTVINKIINYEKNKRAGEWRKKITFFSADEESIPQEMFQVIEPQVFKIFSGVVSYDFDVTATLAYRGSNYRYIPEKFPDKFAERINEGTLIFTYFGHGDKDWLGPVLKDKKHLPIFQSKYLKLLKNKEEFPIFFLICCLVGGFDFPDKVTLSENLLFNKFGAISVFASTRVSDPYGNAIIAKELLQEIFKEKRERLGEVIVNAKRNLIYNNDYLRKKIDSFADLMFDYMAKNYPELKENKEKYVLETKKYHNYLYNLIGDPALVISYPEYYLQFKIPKKIKKGEILKIEEETEKFLEGDGIITLECERDKIIYPLISGENLKDQIIEKNYNNANNKVIYKEKFRFKDGFFKIDLKIPEDLPKGKYFIKCYLTDNKNIAIGSSYIIVED